MKLERLIVASHNEHKIQEIRAILDLPELSLSSLREIGFHDEIIESGKTLEENAEIKARSIFDKTSLDILSDDSGLEVESLKGAPGVYSARYAGSQKSDLDNINKLLRELEGVSNRKAQFRTVLCLCLKGEKYFFEGIVPGKIALTKRGKNGFGYDPIFVPDGFKQSFAEMDSSQKNNISHRTRALEKLSRFLKPELD